MSNQEDQGDNQGTGGRSLGGGGAYEPLPDSWARPTSQPRVGRVGGNTSAGSTGAARIAGLHDSSLGPSVPSFTPGGGGHDHDDSDDDQNDPNQPQNFFAGGERSGISVQGPSRGGNNIVRDILKKAVQGGQTHVPARSSRPGPFSGGGHTLGTDDIPSSFIADPNKAEDTEDNEDTAIRHVTFWRDGFSVEDGALLRYDVEENARLLNDINTGHVPPSILNVRAGQPVELRVARRTNEDYVPAPKRPMAAFDGQGQRLGSPLPGLAGSATTVAERIPGAFPATTSGSTSQANASSTGSSIGESMFEVDQTAPMTSVQVRLADGTRLVARMNLTHTVGDIRKFINASRPGQSAQPYTIGTTFPNRTLGDDSITLDAAGLKNSVVVQRLT